MKSLMILHVHVHVCKVSFLWYPNFGNIPVSVSKVRGTCALNSLNSSLFLCIGKSSLGVASSSEAVLKYTSPSSLVCLWLSNYFTESNVIYSQIHIIYFIINVDILYSQTCKILE